MKGVKSKTCHPHQVSPFTLPPCPLLRYLCDKVVPGNRVTIMGIYSIKKFGLTSSKGRDRVGVGIRSSYIRVLGIQVDTDGSGELALGRWDPGFFVPWAESPLSPGLYLGLRGLAPTFCVLHSSHGERCCHNQTACHSAEMTVHFSLQDGSFSRGSRASMVWSPSSSDPRPSHTDPLLRGRTGVSCLSAVRTLQALSGAAGWKRLPLTRLSLLPAQAAALLGR